MEYASDFIMDDGREAAMKQEQHNANQDPDAGGVAEAERWGALSDLHSHRPAAETVAKVARQRDQELAGWTAKVRRRGYEGRKTKGALDAAAQTIAVENADE
jgi:hypothetical protein